LRGVFFTRNRRGFTPTAILLKINLNKRKYKGVQEFSRNKETKEEKKHKG
jgi:hypothetical protein